MIIKLGQSILDSDSHELRGPQGSMQLQHQLVDFVIYMSRHQGQTVSRDELIAAVWNDYPGADQSLTNTVYKLRSALAAVGADKSCVQTVPKRGYRLSAVDVPDPVDDAAHTSRRRMKIWQIVLLAVTTLGLIAVVLSQTKQSVKPALEKSIAVLAFDDLSKDNSKQFLALGLAEQLTTRLAKATDLRVIGRSSSFALSGKNLTVDEIAEKLQVSHILEGSVQSDGDHIRVNVQLIDAQLNSHLWSQSYDDITENLFAVQDRIVEDTVTAIGAVFIDRLNPTENVIAAPPFQDYLQAKYLAAQGSSEGNEQALRLLEKLVADHPDYVPVLTLMARLLFRQQQHEQSRQYLQRALQIDPGDALANTFFAWSELMRARDPRKVAAFMRTALRSEPQNPDVLITAARFAVAIGQQEQAIGLASQAVEIDPYCGPCLYQLTVAYFYNKQFEFAAQTLVRYQKIGRGGWVLAARIKLMQERPEAALAALQQMLPPKAYEPYWLATKARAHYASGNDADFESALAKLQSWADREPLALAYVYAWTGEHTQAFALLQSRLDDYFDTLHDNPDLQPLQDDPRWEMLMTAAGMADAEVADIILIDQQPD